jgi:catechol 2,3-dioxygenase-like lactoylglutathione lyase family enzyme
MTHVLQGLGTVSFFAADLAAAKRWYANFLGIEPYFERQGYAEFRRATTSTN